MPTQNLELTTAWVKVADAADAALTMELTTGLEWEAACTAGDPPAAGLIGHLICDERVTRADLGAGAVYARTRLHRETLVITK